MWFWRWKRVEVLGWWKMGEDKKSPLIWYLSAYENKEKILEILFASALALMVIYVLFKKHENDEYLSDTQIQHETHKVSNKLQNKQKGVKYELQIGKLYQRQGYKVYFKGINEGVRDKGIDLIAYKGKEALLIQCKNWEHSQIKQEHLRIFLGDCTAYIEQNQRVFAKKNVQRVFVTSCKNVDYGVKKFITENNVEYRIIPYEA